MDKTILLCVVVVLSTISFNVDASGVRQPKFFFISSSTSTTTVPTTLPSSVTATCLVLTSTSYMACPEGARKKKAIIHHEQIEVNPSKSNRKSKDMNVEPSGVSTVEEPQGGREAGFAWYYMTTTLTTTAYSTTYSETTVRTVSVSALNCTPSSFIGCGK